MSEDKVQIMVDGGKAAASPQMAQSLGPKGINIKDVLAQINEKTKHFTGMKVPVDITIDVKTKSFTLSVGTPPTAELIKKEIGAEKGSGMPDKDKKGNLGIEQVIKIAQMKQDNMLVKSFKAAVKNVVGTCGSLGVLVEGKTSKQMCVDIDSKMYDKEILAKNTEVSDEKKKLLESELKRIQDKLKAELALVAKKEEVKVEVKEEVKVEVKDDKKGAKKDDKKAAPVAAKKEEKKDTKKDVKKK